MGLFEKSSDVEYHTDLFHYFFLVNRYHLDLDLSMNKKSVCATKKDLIYDKAKKKQAIVSSFV